MELYFDWAGFVNLICNISKGNRELNSQNLPAQHKDSGFVKA